MKTDLSKKIGLRIKELRLSKSLKQCELADMLNMERSNLTRIENGKQRPTDENLVKIAEILKVTPSELFDVTHILPKDELITAITELLPQFTQQELQFFYKSIINFRQIKK